MSKQELLQQYKNDVNNLRKCAKELNFSDKEITKIFKQCFNELDHENPKPPRNSGNAQKYATTILKIFFIFTLVSTCIYILLNVHQPTSSLVLRNVQGLIYPGLKILRFLSVPIIRKYPSLTGLYDESCLVENPYFYVSDMECWPCENVHSVMDLTGFDNHSLYQSGTPYIIKTQQKEVFFEDLKQLYVDNKGVFDKEANYIKSTNSSVSSLGELFEFGVQSSTHVTWRINKMSPGRLIRQLFPRPPIISEWSGQSIERFIIMDAPNATPYVLPNPECSYVILTQGMGERTIILKPSRECGDVCRTVSVVLKPSYMLWYNWWYWRPISLPNSPESSITYLSSYC
ncbi:hypothetical protein Zmor_009553 [Zophobas morio]|uniref:Uncharacterized protein n=1 Tax=Zophobas morio TaxID=2755281 RepID=A0AA38MI46_9CUCU|nr:hypothetical protein Zmor_009553 [Zophobas morio]